jgi:hypothetical protein
MAGDVHGLRAMEVVRVPIQGAAGALPEHDIGYEAGASEKLDHLGRAVVALAVDAHVFQ